MPKESSLYLSRLTPITSAEMAWSRMAMKALPGLVRNRFLPKKTEATTTA